MTKPLAVTTPQFRTALIRKLRNMFPDYRAEFADGPNGRLTYRLVDGDGVAQIGWVTINRNTGDALTVSHLRQSIRSAGSPEHGSSTAR